MPGFRTATKLAGIAVASLILSAPASLAAGPQHHPNHPSYSTAQSYYDENQGFGVGNEAAFPNTTDNSTKCVNGYRYIRHNYDWFKTTGESELPVPCR